MLEAGASPEGEDDPPLYGDAMFRAVESGKLAMVETLAELGGLPTRRLTPAAVIKPMRRNMPAPVIPPAEPLDRNGHASSPPARNDRSGRGNGTGSISEPEDAEAIEQALERARQRDLLPESP